MHVSELVVELRFFTEYASVHCLEKIRRSIMCRADLAPLQFYWSNSTIHDLKVKAVVQQMCLKRESFEAVRQTRTYDRAALQHYHEQGF